MTIPRVLIALTVANLGLLVLLVGRIRSAEAGGVEPVLRGRALEIVDDRGRLRASIKVRPPGHMPNGGRGECGASRARYPAEVGECCTPETGLGTGLSWAMRAALST